MPNPPERMHRHSGPIKKSGEMRPVTQAEQQAYLNRLEAARQEKIERHGGADQPRGLSVPDKSREGKERCFTCRKTKRASTMYHIGDTPVCPDCTHKIERQHRPEPL